jgi:hypothetical protein
VLPVRGLVPGAPEGTGPGEGRPRPRWLVLLVVAFAVYLSIRLVQVLVWVVQALM